MNREDRNLAKGALEEIRKGLIEREQMISNVASYKDYCSFCEAAGGPVGLNEHEFKVKLSLFFKDSYRLLEAAEECESIEFITLLVGLQMGLLKNGPDYLSKVSKLISVLSLAD
jgi:hypothetical protein